MLRVRLSPGAEKGLPRVTRSPSCGLLDIPSNSTTGLVAANHAVLIVEKVLVEQAVQDAYKHHLACCATLPNSVYKRLPHVNPPPGPTWEDGLQKQALASYAVTYDNEHNPRPEYKIEFIPPAHPVLAPRPPPPPPVLSRKDKIKMEKDKKAKGKKK